jgi:hypothetical protein
MVGVGLFRAWFRRTAAPTGRQRRAVRLRVEGLEARALPDAGYLRVVTYNIASSASPGTPRSGLDTILKGIGDESVNNHSEPIDLLALQEVYTQSATCGAVADALNDIYGAGTYSHGSTNGGSTGSGTQGIVYNTNTLELLSEATVAPVTLSGGTATLDASFSASGSHTVSAAYDGDSNFNTSSSTDLTETVYAPPTVASVKVNGDSSTLQGTQRSEVKSIVYTFDHAVSLGSSAFSIALRTTVTVNGVTQSDGFGTLPTLSWSSPDGGLTWVVTFSGSGVTNGSIADGVYDITLASSAVTDETGQTLSADRTDTFYRLYGDDDGNKRVNNTDLNAFGTTFNLTSSDTGYLVYFDSDGNGRVNNTDLNALANNFNKVLGGFTATV